MMEDSTYMIAARHCLDEAKAGACSPEKAIELAGFMIEEAKRIQTSQEKEIQAQLARMMNDPQGKAFLTSMTDQCFRCQSYRRVANQLVYLINKFGIPKFLSNYKKMQLWAFKWFGRPFAEFIVPLVKHMLRKETATVILPGETDQLSKHLNLRKSEGVDINLNHLGEAILGEKEAEKRLEVYLKDLQNPEIECVSVKISTIYSQINLLSRQDTLIELSKRLKLLYREAKAHQYIRKDGNVAAKFVNLDMEEYRDLYLTVELFKNVLEEPEFHDYSAGIVLQSYLPDSHLIQKELTGWASKRVSNGGAPIKIRIVKGANLAMEQVEASMRLWPQAPYHTKAEVDANFKRMVIYGCQPENARVVNLGIASHNLFDVAYALLLRSKNNVEHYVCFEMLEGMADHQRRVVQQLSDTMLLYCPAATREEFQNAVAYLVRRLDENTAPENFLRYAFEMHPGTPEWESQSELFLRAFERVDSVKVGPLRLQNRLKEPVQPAYKDPFVNEADTDWSLPQNVIWAEKIVNQWKSKEHPNIPLAIGNTLITFTEAFGEGMDPSIPGKVLYRYVLGGQKELESTLNASQEGFQAWSEKPLKQRLLILAEVAQEMRRRRGDLIGAMMADTGKTVFEADVEISEAIDFVEYYRRNVEELHTLSDISWGPKGPMLVAPPWNFPCSIPVGGIAAALAGGNSVIFKPAPEAILVGWHVANIFWEAGIDKNVLQFFCCHDDPIGSALIKSPIIKAVILTGATSTAKLFLKMRPGLDLMAETGGKNAMIVTSMADRDLAIKDLVQSAFGHAGQKCSACSLAILEKEVYEDVHFRRQLRDAASSLKVGSPWHLSTKVNPLIRQPNPELLKGLTTLEAGEEWLLEPSQDKSNPQLWSPGIKLGVKAGGFMHMTELFGPVLGVMCADDLDEAISFVNATPYGLTSGIHTLDEREHEYWLKRVVAGNCYINRGITGAIVQRQPFGGCKESSFGPGAKAGGPNYLMQMMKAEQISLPQEREAMDESLTSLDAFVQKKIGNEGNRQLWEVSLGSYAFFWKHYFSKDHDPSKVQGQHNILRYVPQVYQIVRIQKNDSPLDIWRVLAAAKTCGAKFEVSCDLFMAEMLKGISHIQLIVEDEALWIRRLQRDKHLKRIRLLSEIGSELQQALADLNCIVVVAPVLANGRLELVHWLREVSISHDYHRYGYLG